MKNIEIFIPGRIPSKKNSTVQIIRNGKPLKFPSKNYVTWEKESMAFLLMQWRPKLKANKVKIGYFFVRPDRRKADISNKIESINDMLVKYWFIEDDSWDKLWQKWADTHERWVDPENPWVYLDIDYEREEWYVHPAMRKNKKIEPNLFDDFLRWKEADT